MLTRFEIQKISDRVPSRRSAAGCLGRPGVASKRVSGGARTPDPQNTSPKCVDFSSVAFSDAFDIPLLALKHEKYGSLKGAKVLIGYTLSPQNDRTASIETHENRRTLKKDRVRFTLDVRGHSTC